MPITAPTYTSEFAGFLKPEQAAPFWEITRRTSVVQSLIPQRAIGINGQEMPVKLGKLTAGWVAEGGKKPASKGAIGLTSWRAHKIAAITVVSAETVRANPGGYMDDLRPEIAEAFAVEFDRAVLLGTGPFGAGENLAAATKTVTLGTATAANGGIYADFNAAIAAVVTDTSGGTRKRVTGWALDSVAEPTLNGAVDLNGRPIFLESPYDGTPPLTRNGTLLGRPSRMAEHIADDADLANSPVGYAADWTQMVWGQIGGISYDVSTQATVTINGELVSLWENNLLAIRAETEFAFKMRPGVKGDGTVGGPGDDGGALDSVVKIMPVGWTATP